MIRRLQPALKPPRDQERDHLQVRIVAPRVDVQLFMCLLSALPEETRYILGFVSFLMQRASSELFRCKVNQMAD